MKPFGPGAFADIENLTGLRLSPDGRYLSYTVSKPDLKLNTTKNYIAVYDIAAETEKIMTHSGSDGAAEWLDNDTLIFCAVRNEDDKMNAAEGTASFYTLSISGGEAQRVFTVPVRKAAAAGVFPCGKILISGEVVYNRPGLGQEELWDYYDEYPYHFDGFAYINKHRGKIWVYDMNTGELVCPMEPLQTLYPYGSFQVTGNVVYYYCNSFDRDQPTHLETWSYDALTGERKRLTGTELRPVKTCIHDGRIYIATQNKARGNEYNTCDMYSCLPDGSDLRHEYRSEHPVTGMISTPDGLRLVQTMGFRDEIHGYTGTADTVCVHSGPTIMQAVYLKGKYYAIAKPAAGNADLYEFSEKGCRCLTGHSRAFREKYYVGEPERLSYTDPEGFEIEGWVIKPMGYEPGKKYPGVLHIHGGPQGHYGVEINQLMQIFVSEGYFVFYCNPRGSNGYGNKHMEIFEQYGPYGFNGTMGFTDAVLEKYPDLDAEKLGVTGISYGGYMTNWIITHTDRFKAAVPMRSISNFVSMYGTSDIKYYVEYGQGGTQTVNVEKLWDSSPLKYADNVKTPSLFLQNTYDYRCPVEQAEQLFTALLERGVPTAMKVNKKASHGVLKPLQTEHDNILTIEWMNKYIKGEH